MYATTIDVRSNLVDTDSASVSVNFSKETFDEVIFSVSVNTSELDSTKYINIDVSILALFEVLPWEH